MTRAGFEAEVGRVLAEIPEPFQSRLEGVSVLIEERPTRDDFTSSGIRKGTLFGLFRGRALTASDEFAPPELPPQVVLFRSELEAAFPDESELKTEIRTTLLHELGHYFGLTERDLVRLGYR